MAIVQIGGRPSHPPKTVVLLRILRNTYFKQKDFKNFSSSSPSSTSQLTSHLPYKHTLSTCRLLLQLSSASLVASFAVSAHSEQSPPKNQEILNKSLNFKIKCPTEAPVPPKWACTWPNNNESTNWKISFEGRLLKLPKDLI